MPLFVGASESYDTDAWEAYNLKKENAELRELMYERAHKHAIHHMTEDELRITAANVMDENVKLRKLVKQMHDHIKESCDICDEYYCSEFDEDNECCIYDTLAREVGIEVNG